MILKNVADSLFYGAARVLCKGLKQKVSLEQRRDNRAAARNGGERLGDPHPELYFVDGYHGGITFWDWIILPGGRTWKLYNWPVVAEPILKRILNNPSLAAVFELDAHTYGCMQKDFPGAVARLKEALATGRLEVVNGTFAQPLSGTYDGETYVRHFFYGLREISEVLKTEVETFASQEPAFFPQLPQILSAFNYRLAVLRTHWAPFGADPAHQSSLFKWQAADGSWIWTVPRYPFMNYGKEEGNVSMHYGQDNPDHFMAAHLLPRGFAGYSRAGLEQFQKLSRESGIKKPLLTRLEDFNVLSGAPLKGAATLSGYDNVHFVTLKQYLAQNEAEGAIFSSEAERVYFSSDQIPCYYPWGLQGGAPLEMSQRASRRLLEAERLDVLARLRGGAGCPEQLEQAWKSALHSQHHDLHLCGPWLSRLHGKSMGEVAVRLASSAIEKAEEVIDRSIGAIVKDRVVKNRGAADRCTFAVFNTRAYPRRDAVYLPLGGGPGFLKEWKAYARGKELPAQWVPSSGGGGFLALMIDLPAFGGDLIKVVGTGMEPKASVLKTEATEGLSFHNRYYRAALDLRGHILLKSAEGEACVEGGYLTVWDGGRYFDSRSVQTAVSLVSSGPPACIYAVEGKIGEIPFIQEFTFYHDLPRVEVRIEFDFGAGCFFGPQKEESRQSKAYYVQHDKKMNLNAALSGGDYILAGGAYIAEQREAEDLSATGFITMAKTDQPSWSFLRPGTCGYRWEKESGLLQAILAWAPREWLYASEDSMRVGGSSHTILQGRYSYRYAFAVGPADVESLLKASEEYENPFIVRGVSGEGDGFKNGCLELLKLNPKAPALTALFAREGKTYLRLCNYSPRKKELFLGKGKLRPVNLKLEPEGGPQVQAALAPGRIQTFELID